MKKIICTLYIFMISIYSYSQEVRWGKNNVNANTESCATPAGDLLLLAVYFDVLEFKDTTLVPKNTDLNNKEYKLCLTKIDKQGHVVWSNYIMPYKNTINQFSLVSTPNDTIYISLTYTDSLKFGNSSFRASGAWSTYDAALLKFASDGTFIWAKNFASAMDDRAFNMALDDNNNIFFTGYFFDSLVVENKNYYTSRFDVNHSLNFYIFKYAANGDLLKTLFISNSNIKQNNQKDFLRIQVQNNKLSLMLFETFDSIVVNDKAYNVKTHPWGDNCSVLVYDLDFNLLSNHDMGPIIPPPLGTYGVFDKSSVFAGQYKDANFQIDSVDKADNILYRTSFMVKFNMNKHLDTLLYIKGDPQFTALSFDENGNIYTAANYSNIYIDTAVAITPKTTYGNFIMKMDSDFHFLWLKSFDGHNNSVAYDNTITHLNALKENELYISGYIFNGLVFSYDSLFKYSGGSFFVYMSPIGLGNVIPNSAIVKAPNMALYPNPANTQLSLLMEGKAGAKVVLDIIDISGRLVWSGAETILSNQSPIHINTSALSNGIYFLKVSEQNSQSVVKFEVNR
ncbi:MAG: T9SS type A sorting domain-containing protein [Bacteroidetes bacterium]|nr:T9SS type A sorting domain-containing protein [Bacteroidota bacterium]